jgi:hypothetical protein
MADLKYDMTAITRDFLRRFAHYKRQAEAGKVVRLRDRQGRTFLFQAEKPARHMGAAKHMFKGKLLSPARVPKEEWKGLY